MQTVIEVGPYTAQTTEDLEFLIARDDDGLTETFYIGDTVTLTHEPSGSHAVGILANFFGVGRIRGIDIDTAAFGGVSFYFGQPGDPERGFVLSHKEES